MSKLILPFFLGMFCFLQSIAQDYNTILIPEGLKHDANAVVRTNKVSYELPRANRMEVNIQWAITVFNEEGLKYLGSYAYYNDASKITDIEILIFDGSGERTDKYGKKDFKDISAVDGGTLYSDSRLLYLDYTPVSYPFTMEMSYRRTTANTSFIPSCYFLRGYDISTQFSSFELIYGEEFDVPRVLERNLEGRGVIKEISPGRIYYEAANQEAIKKEYLSPSIREVFPNIEVAMNQFHYEGKDGYVTNWEELGSWMYRDILKDRQSLSEATKAEVRALTKGVEDIYEKSKIVYNYVQDQTRYISVQVGIGGIQPIAAIEVDKVKYGDCKGLTNYTIALLQAVGVKSYYVHVESGSEMHDFSKDFASFGAGDHVILAIPYQEGYIWSDCTSKIHPFGFLGDFTDNRNVLVITPEGGRLERTEAYLDEVNALRTVADCHLTADGAMKADLELTSEGIQYDQYFSKWERTRDEKDIKEWFTRFWPYLNGFSLESFAYENDKDHVVLEEDLQVNVLNYMSKAGDQLLLNLNAFNRKTNIPDRYRNRKLPFAVKRGFLDEDQYTFHLPEGYRLESIPLPVSLETEFGTYSASCTLGTDNTITYKRYFLLKSGSYPKEKYKDFRDFQKKVKQADQKKVLLVPVGELAEK